MSPNPAIDIREFRNALGSFATGVTIVTAKGQNGGYVGTTASSFNSVSVDPPLILWSIDKGARALSAYEQAEHFCVHVLAADQVGLSNHFARQQEDKFADVDCHLNAEGVPVLQGCVARFHCKTKHLYEGGDHIIVVGEVLQFDTTGRAGLLFHQGSYAVSGKHPVAGAVVQDGASNDDSFADDYLHYLVGRSFHQLRQKLESMLSRQGLQEYEYRVLASLSGRDGCSLSILSKYAVLERAELITALRLLEDRGLVKTDDTGPEVKVCLTYEGSENLVPLLAAAKANEADALGSFNIEEAQVFKRYLKKMVAWTG